MRRRERLRDDTIRAAPVVVSHALSRIALVVLCVALGVPAAQGAPARAVAPRERADVRVFIDELVRDDGFDRAALQRVFARVRYRGDVIAAMQRPLVAPPKWYEYSAQFLTPKRIEAGVRYWDANAEALAQVEQRFGVPAEIVVAILGVETFYGRNTGRYRAIDALATLAFDYPRRAAFFRAELRQFLLLARELGVSPLEAKGSFAGALGVPQFMPGSYRSYAVDFSGNGRPDLWASAADVVASVANFLARHDWQPGQPVLLAAAFPQGLSDDVLRRLDGGITERRAIEAWAADGVLIADAPADLPGDPVGVLELEQDGASGVAARYFIACNNFYVLTRYNRSRLYAATVWELAKAIKAERAR